MRKMVSHSFKSVGVAVQVRARRAAHDARAR
jgi:hypothetical protein